MADIDLTLLQEEVDELTAAAQQFCETPIITLSANDLTIIDEGACDSGNITAYSTPGFPSLQDVVTQAKDEVYNAVFDDFTTMLDNSESTAAGTYVSQDTYSDNTTATNTSLEARFATMGNEITSWNTTYNSNRVTDNSAIASSIQEQHSQLSDDLNATIDEVRTTAVTTEEAVASAALMTAVEDVDNNRLIMSGFSMKSSTITGSEFNVYADKFQLLNGDGSLTPFVIDSTDPNNVKMIFEGTITFGGDTNTALSNLDSTAADAIDTLNTVTGDLQNQVDGNITTWFVGGTPEFEVTDSKYNSDDTSADLVTNDFIWDKLGNYPQMYKYLGANTTNVNLTAEDYTDGTRWLSIYKINSKEADWYIADNIDATNGYYWYSGTDTQPLVDSGKPVVTTERDKHRGDLFYNLLTGYAYRFSHEDITDTPDRQIVYSWILITDTDVTKALADAAKAQDTADGKRRVFGGSYLVNGVPYTPYDEGDLWDKVNNSQHTLMRCVQSRVVGASYNQNDWELSSTDNTRAEEAALTATWGSIDRRPEDSGNLNPKPFFEDNKRNGWTGTIVSVSGQAFTKAIQWAGRDIYCNSYYSGNYVFPVDPQGETLFIDVWADTTDCPYSCDIGVETKNTDDTHHWNGITVPANTGWAHYTGKVTTPTGHIAAKPWANQGTGSNYGTPRLAGLKILRSQSGADKTSENTAAAINGQGDFATKSSVALGSAYITGGVHDLDYTGSLNADKTSDSSQSIDWIKKNSKTTHSISADGWYRIAYNTGNRALAKFTVSDETGSRHNTAIFTVGISYGNNPTFSLLSFDIYDTHTITKARLIKKSTYDQPYVEVYITSHGSGTAYSCTITDNLRNAGWYAVNWTAGSIPSGYTAIEYPISSEYVVDSTGQNTSADTAQVNGVASYIVQGNAHKAKKAVDNQASDGIFSVQEKATWRVQWEGIQNNYQKIIDQAGVYGIQNETVFTDFVTARDNLYSYLNDTQHVWATSPTDTPITITETGTDLQSKVANFYAKMQLAVNKLADSAHTYHGIAENADKTDYRDNKVANAILQDSVLTVQRPIGGAYASASSSKTGAIKIVLPQSWTNTMLKMNIDIYNYSSNVSFELKVAGYTQTDGTKWHNTTAKLIGDDSADNRIRFGHDGTHCIIVIGDTNSNWGYPNITVRNFQAGYLNYAISQWETGWNVTIDNSLSGCTFTKDYSDALIDANRIKGQKSLATQDTVGKSNLDGTILANDHIATPLLTANNIQAGTLDASIVNVANLNAANINVGELDAERIKLNGAFLTSSSNNLDIVNNSISNVYTGNVTSDSKTTGITILSGIPTTATSKVSIIATGKFYSQSANNGICSVYFGSDLVGTYSAGDTVHHPISFTNSFTPGAGSTPITVDYCDNMAVMVIVLER